MDAPLTEKQRYALMLWHAQGIGATLFNKLLDKQYGMNSWGAFLELAEPIIGEKKFHAILANKTQIADAVNQLEHWLAQSSNHNVLYPFEDDYPERLQQLAQPPLLFCLGDKEVLSSIQIAIVGSRNASEQALRQSYEFSNKLAAVGLTITSGLAYGIDGSAHQGCIETHGKTVAVLGSGVDTIYPKAHAKLADGIIEKGGAIVSEFVLGTSPRPHHFPQRNRIISGLSDGVLVIEAAEKSGSLITARYAMEQNRDVYTIPGSIYNANKKGCHNLIKQGAILVDEVQDIIDNIELKYDLSLTVEAAITDEQLTALSVIEQQFVELLSFEQVKSFNELVANVPNPNFAALMQTLQSLMIKGIVLEQSPGLYIRV